MSEEQEYIVLEYIVLYDDGYYTHEEGFTPREEAEQRFLQLKYEQGLGFVKATKRLPDPEYLPRTKQ